MYLPLWVQSRVQLDSAFRFKGPMSSNSRQCLPFYYVQCRVQTDELFYFLFATFLRSRRLVASLLTFKTRLYVVHPRCVRCIQIRSKDSQVKTQLVLWIFILFKVTR